MLSPKDWMVFEIGMYGRNLKAHKFGPYLTNLPQNKIRDFFITFQVYSFTKFSNPKEK
jgi:hypothetical protein